MLGGRHYVWMLGRKGLDERRKKQKCREGSGGSRGVEKEYEAAQRMHFKHNAAFSNQESIHLFN